MSRVLREAVRPRGIPVREHFTGDGEPKVGYRTKREAWAAANATDGRLRPYDAPCSVCGEYHLASRAS